MRKRWDGNPSDTFARTAGRALIARRLAAKARQRWTPQKAAQLAAREQLEHGLRVEGSPISRCNGLYALINAEETISERWFPELEHTENDLRLSFDTVILGGFLEVSIGTCRVYPWLMQVVAIEN